jgi:hypothetical protein
VPLLQLPVVGPLLGWLFGGSGGGLVKGIHVLERASLVGLKR